MKNYGLCIWNSNNYGSNLTNFCFFNLIKSFGHNPLVLTSKSNIEANYKDFIDFNYPKMKVENINTINKYLDGVIVGSDWTFYFSTDNTFRKRSQRFLLNNITVPKFSVASSLVPPKKLSYLVQDNIRNSLEKFKFLSIRESDTIKYLTDFYHIKNKVYDILDPVLLIGKEFLLELAQKSNLKYSNYNVFYALADKDNSKKEIFENEKKIIVIENPDKKDIRKNSLNENIEYCNSMSIYDFVYTIANCDKIFTDSYHGLVLSLIFEKPVKYMHRYTKERFTSLEKIIQNNSCNIKREDYRSITPLLLKRIQQDRTLVEEALK